MVAAQTPAGACVYLKPFFLSCIYKDGGEGGRDDLVGYTPLFKINSISEGIIEHSALENSPTDLQRAVIGH